MMKMQNVGGKISLQVHRYCFDSRLKSPLTEGSSNTRQKKTQSEAKNKRQLEKAVASGWKKGRRMKQN